MPHAPRGALVAALLLCALASDSLAAPCPVDPAGEDLMACFDDVGSGSAASAASYAHLDVLDALVLSEGDAAFLLGFDTAGWATTGDQGILNSLLPSVDLFFDETIRSFRTTVVGLPGLGGELVPVVLQAFADGDLLHTVVSDTSGVLPDGTHRDTLELDGSFVDHVRLFAAAAPCVAGECEVGRTSGFFADSVEYRLPEPAPLALLAAAAAAIVVGRRTAPGS